MTKNVIERIIIVKYVTNFSNPNAKINQTHIKRSINVTILNKLLKSLT